MRIFRIAPREVFTDRLQKSLIPTSCHGADGTVQTDQNDQQSNAKELILADSGDNNDELDPDDQKIEGIKLPTPSHPLSVWKPTPVYLAIRESRNV